MIRHASLPARDPQRVATALAEIMGGRAYRFAPISGAFMAASGDPHGTMIEIYPEEIQLAPDEAGLIKKGAPAAFHPFHLLISVPVERADIERIGAREGWQTEFCAAGAPGQKAAFHLYRMWIENRVLIEFVTDWMAAEYEEYYRHFDGFDASPRNEARATA